MIKSLNELSPISTSHNVGKKLVLLSSEESGCSITQIAIIDLKVGEVAAVHVHEDMQEGFYMMSGELDVVLDGAIEHCVADDFVWVECGTRHELRAQTDVRVMTIGCAM